jgi:DNA-binding NtrC family response regulator
MMKVLIADDAEDIRSVLRGPLREAGYEVSEAATASEALAIVASEDIEVIISDLQIGDANGFVLLQQAKELRPRVKAALMSGFVISAKHSGVPFPVLSKPFRPRDLISLIERMLRESDDR